jgi:uncharacterized membrane protein
MNTKISPLIEKARASFWFVPSIMVLLSLCLAAFTIYLDATHTEKLNDKVSFLYGADVDAIRSLLGTVAASMITVTSIAFSITIVTLTLASSQFGPRLMRNFMMDKGTQLVLGTFISTFLYCVAVFCAISFEKPYAFTPGITIVVSIALTCISVCILIYFIHHVAKSIQADIVIDDVYCELRLSIEKQFPDGNNKKATAAVNSSELKKYESYHHNMEVLPSVSGYLQLIDRESLLKVAADSNCIIKLHFMAGDFIVENASIATVYSNIPIENIIHENVKKHIVIGSYRTPVQDPEFAVHQLVEIALRALSPGINDPYTAITCIDKLCAVLCCLEEKSFPQPEYFIDQELRLVCKELRYIDIASAAFDQIRDNAETNLAVTLKIVDSLQVLAARCKTEEHCRFVSSQADRIQQQQAKQSMSDIDKHKLGEKLETITNSNLVS